MVVIITANKRLDKLVVASDSWVYWTHVEEYPMHLDPHVVLPKARARFWSAITFLSSGALHARVILAEMTDVRIARVFEDDEFVLSFTGEQIGRIIETYEVLSGKNTAMSGDDIC